jgi:hypothetical protein
MSYDKVTGSNHGLLKCSVAAFTWQTLSEYPTSLLVVVLVTIPLCLVPKLWFEVDYAF